MSDYHGVFYKDEAGEFRWTVKAKNGEVVSDSGEGYKNRGDALAIFSKLHPNVKLDFQDES